MTATALYWIGGLGLAYAAALALTCRTCRWLARVERRGDLAATLAGLQAQIDELRDDAARGSEVVMRLIYENVATDEGLRELASLTSAATAAAQDRADIAVELAKSALDLTDRCDGRPRPPLAGTLFDPRNN